MHWFSNLAQAHIQTRFSLDTGNDLFDYTNSNSLDSMTLCTMYNEISF